MGFFIFPAIFPAIFPWKNGDFPSSGQLQEFDLPIATWPPGSAEELLQELGSGSTLSLRQGESRVAGGGDPWGPQKNVEKTRENQPVDIVLLGKSTINVQKTMEALGKSTINVQETMEPLGKSTINVQQTMEPLGKSTINVQQTMEPLGKSTINDNFSIAILA